MQHLSPLPPSNDRAGDGPRLMQCIVDGGWKLFRHYDPTGASQDVYELYDLTLDEDMTENLAANPDCAPVMKRLLRQLFEATQNGHSREAPSSEPLSHPA